MSNEPQPPPIANMLQGDEPPKEILLYRDGTLACPNDESVTLRLERLAAGFVAKKPDVEFPLPVCVVAQRHLASLWALYREAKEAEKWVPRAIYDERAEAHAAATARIAGLASLLQQMLDVAENCDETGYADGVGFVDLDKLHAEVRQALSATPPEQQGRELAAANERNALQLAACDCAAMLDTAETHEGNKTVVQGNPAWSPAFDSVMRRTAECISLREQLAEARGLFTRHTTAVEGFLNELYSIMVDPLAEGHLEVSEIKEALLNAARRSREVASESATPTAEVGLLKATIESARVALLTCRVRENYNPPYCYDRGVTCDLSEPLIAEALKRIAALSDPPDDTAKEGGKP